MRGAGGEALFAEYTRHYYLFNTESVSSDASFLSNIFFLL